MIIFFGIRFSFYFGHFGTSLWYSNNLVLAKPQSLWFSMALLSKMSCIQKYGSNWEESKDVNFFLLYCVSVRFQQVFWRSWLHHNSQIYSSGIRGLRSRKKKWNEKWKKKFAYFFLNINYCQFLNLLKEHFVKHKPFIFEECAQISKVKFSSIVFFFAIKIFRGGKVGTISRKIKMFLSYDSKIDMVAM